MTIICSLVHAIIPRIFLSLTEHSHSRDFYCKRLIFLVQKHHFFKFCPFRATFECIFENHICGPETKIPKQNPKCQTTENAERRYDYHYNQCNDEHHSNHGYDDYHDNNHNNNDYHDNNHDNQGCLHLTFPYEVPWEPHIITLYQPLMVKMRIRITIMLMMMITIIIMIMMIRGAFFV